MSKSPRKSVTVVDSPYVFKRSWNQINLFITNQILSRITDINSILSYFYLNINFLLFT
jgi:hypothetical protein